MSNRRELLILRCNHKMIMFLVVIKSISIWGETKRRGRKKKKIIEQCSKDSVNVCGAVEGARKVMGVTGIFHVIGCL